MKKKAQTWLELAEGDLAFAGEVVAAGKRPHYSETILSGVYSSCCKGVGFKNTGGLQMAQGTIEHQKIVDEVSRLLMAEGITPQEIILFGSQATGTAHDGSDVDVVVISKDLHRYRSLDRLEMLSRIAWKSIYPLEILGYTPDEVKDKARKSIIWDEILASGKTLYRAA